MRILRVRQLLGGRVWWRVAQVLIPIAVILNWTSCTDIENPAEGTSSQSECCKGRPMREILLEMDMCPMDPMPTLYGDWVDSDHEGPLQSALRAVCNEVVGLDHDPMDSGIDAYPQHDADLADIHEYCHSRASNMHLILVKTYSEPDWLGAGVPESLPAYLGGYSFLFCQHINDASGDTNYREELGTLVATHELGHHRGGMENACQDWDPETPSDAHVDSDGVLDPDCVMALLRTVYFEPPLNYRATYSRCSNSNLDLGHNIAFCDSCCKIMREITW